VHRLLKLTVSISQAVVVVAAFAFAKYCHDDRMYVFYVNPFLHVVTKMNYPLLIVLSPILDTLNWLGRFLPTPTGGFRSSIAIVAAVLLTSTVALFWYFVLSEIEMRRHGKSMLRFRRRPVEVAALAVLFISGIGAIRYAWTDGLLLVHIHGSKIEAFVGGLVLLIWGILLIGISIFDLLLYLRPGAHPAS
jgi:hypothetical protein